MNNYMIQQELGKQTVNQAIRIYSIRTPIQSKPPDRFPVSLSAFDL